MKIKNFKYLVDNVDIMKDVKAILISDGVKILPSRYSKIEFDYDHELIVTYVKSKGKDVVCEKIDIDICKGIQYNYEEYVSDIMHDIYNSPLVGY